MTEDKRKMTKEELEKEAEEYANNLAFVFETDVVQRIVRERVRLALIDVLEPREKRIAELEAYNKKLLQSDIDKQNKIVLLSQKVNDLQKENAELKEQNRKLLESCEGATMMYEDLCKAKKILQELANLYGAIHIPMDKVKSLMVKAEKFLK